MGPPGAAGQDWNMAGLGLGKNTTVTKCVKHPKLPLSQYIMERTWFVY